MESFVSHHFNGELQTNLFSQTAVAEPLPSDVVDAIGNQKAAFESMVFEKKVPKNILNKSLITDNQKLVSDLAAFHLSEKIENEQIEYAFVHTVYGNSLMAKTSFGLCFVDLYLVGNQSLAKLKHRFSNNFFKEVPSISFEKVKQNMEGTQNSIQFHLQGTDFQLDVWRLLLQLPNGKVSTYSLMAESLGDEKLSRALGTAVGQNPIAILIPCHRVVYKNGNIGHYMWGPNKKVSLLVHELLLSQ